MPHGTIQRNGSRSLSALTAKPCVVTRRETCTPIDAILRPPVHTPVGRSPPPCAAHALARERRDDRALERAQVADHVADPHDRVADELARAVVGHAAAAVDVDDLDLLRPEESPGRAGSSSAVERRPRV